MKMPQLLRAQVDLLPALMQADESVPASGLSYRRMRQCSVTSQFPFQVMLVLIYYFRHHGLSIKVGNNTWDGWLRS